MTLAAKLTIGELAQTWRCGPRAVLNAIERGELRATKIGGRWLVDAQDVETYEQAKANVQPARPKRTRAPRPRAVRRSA